jgi:methylthioribulose-1-phosphate dehydratase
MSSTTKPLAELNDQVELLRDIGRRFYSRGWSVGTSSNYSLVVDRDPLDLLVTASGMDKGQLSPHDFVRVNNAGQPAFENQPKSSAETMLHVVLAEEPEVGSVLHTHSVWGTLLSDLFYDEGALTISGFEFLKGLSGIKTHESEVQIKIFDNTQDIATLATEVKSLRAAGDPTLKYGFLMRAHGLYTWGKDVAEARRHVEVLEFLFEVLGRRLSLQR